MERLTNLMLGCVRVEAKGALPAILLNSMAKAGVEFWDAEPVDAYTLRFTVHYADLAQVKRLAERALCSLETLGKKGAPVVKRRLRRRRVLIACVVIGLLLLTASSLFVWDIDVTGNETVSTGEILRALDDCGVSIGAFWPGFNGELLRNKMLLLVPDLCWVAVNVDSSRAEVIVRERVEKPETIDEDAPANVTARATGIITKLSVLQGKPVVAVGDAVLAGEELVTGVMDSRLGTTRYVRAMAEVEARTWYEITAEAPLRTVQKSYSGRERTRWVLLIGGERINFYGSSRKTGNNCDKIITSYPFAWDGVFTLPVSIVSERFMDYELTQTEADKGALNASLQADLRDALTQKLDGRGEILGTAFTSAEIDGKLVVTLRAECLEDIAETVPMT